MIILSIALAILPKPSSMVVYEANLRAEGSSGGFAALTRRLDSIQSLGVDVLWLMPVQPVGQLRSAGGLGSPYATRDYDAVNPEFGTPGELRTLIRAAHRRRISVIIDWVANHTAWDHPWVTAHPDWYTRDAKGMITRPAGTNWNDVADLDFAQAPLRQAMTESMVGWVKNYDIDGFRCDTADWVPSDFWKSAITRLRASSPRPLFMLAEGFRPENFQAGFDAQYGWPFYDELKSIYAGRSASALARVATKEAAQGRYHLRFVTNHDKMAWEGVPTDYFGTPSGVRGATVVTALYGGGIPLIYSGQEVAWSKRIPIFDRSTIDWTGSPETRKFLAILNRVRASEPFSDSSPTIDVSTADIVSFTRQSLRVRAWVAVNVRSRASVIPVPKGDQGKWTDAITKESVDVSGEWTLAPYESRVLIRRN